MIDFFDNDVPSHIARVDSESARMFASIRGDKDLLFELIGKENEIDLVLAWNEFDRIAYTETFKQTGCDMEAFNLDPSVRNRIYTKVKPLWQINYFMKLFVKRGIADVVDVKGTDVYFFKSEYKDKIREVLRGSENKDMIPYDNKGQ